MKTIIYAVRISKVSKFTEDGGLLEFADAEPREVATTWLEKHKPSVGQYYVKYSDGFTGVVASLSSTYIEVPAIPKLNFNNPAFKACTYGCSCHVTGTIPCDTCKRAPVGGHSCINSTKENPC